MLLFSLPGVGASNKHRVIKKKTSYTYMCRLVLSRPDFVKYCMKRKYATLH